MADLLELLRQRWDRHLPRGVTLDYYTGHNYVTGLKFLHPDRWRQWAFLVVTQRPGLSLQLMTGREQLLFSYELADPGSLQRPERLLIEHRWLQPEPPS